MDAHPGVIHALMKWRLLHWACRVVEAVAAGRTWMSPFFSHDGHPGDGGQAAGSMVPLPTTMRPSGNLAHATRFEPSTLSVVYVEHKRRAAGLGGIGSILLLFPADELDDYGYKQTSPG